MTHDDVVNALTLRYPGVEWSYDGDGTTLDAVPGVSNGLIWHGDRPPPTIADLKATAISSTATTSALTIVATREEQALTVIQNDPNLDAGTRDTLIRVVQILSS